MARAYDQYLDHEVAHDDSTGSEESSPVLRAVIQGLVSQSIAALEAEAIMFLLLW